MWPAREARVSRVLTGRGDLLGNLLVSVTLQTPQLLEGPNPWKTLSKSVMQQTGLSNEIARQAVGVVLSQLKTQLPKPFADQLDALLGGAGAGDSADVMGTVMKGLGGMLGGGK